jgi:hypothetical protein
LAAEKLNRGLADYFEDDSWKAAYVQRDLPDSISAYAAAAGAAFNARIVGVTPTASEFGDFSGVNYGGINYVNLACDVRFINIRRHEPHHEIERKRR